MSKEIIKFYAGDGVKLNGYLNKGKLETKKVLIAIHGMTSNCFKDRERIIAEAVEEIGIDTICFNNRGSEIVKYIKYGDEKKALAGMAYENVEESIYDIIGAIKYAVELGYTDIYLQGHSLGCTKIVYSYNRMKQEKNKYLKYIKGIVLLSLVDIPRLFKLVSRQKNLDYAIEEEKQGLELELMPKDAFIHPISVKTFLQYTKYNKNLDFAKYHDKDYKYEEINNIEVPIFMRWGNSNEFIEQNANDLVSTLNKKISNKNKDINYIDGANHSYENKEETLATQIKDFLTMYD